MDLDPLIRGTILGFTIAAAVGPISLLTIRRTLARGFAVGMASGLGVATADATYGGIAAFGLTAVTDLLVGQARLLGLIGGAVLVVIGIRTLRSKPPAAPVAEPTTGRSLLAAYSSILGLTLTNPMTILSFAALFASFGTGDGFGGAALITLGVFLGSTAWWVVLISGVTALRSRVTPRALRWINVLSGATIAVFGAIAIGAALLPR
jgi:threonine/homoserine/homoserine lactone efflux protein